MVSGLKLLIKSQPFLTVVISGSGSTSVNNWTWTTFLLACNSSITFCKNPNSTIDLSATINALFTFLASFKYWILLRSK